MEADGGELDGGNYWDETERDEVIAEGDEALCWGKDLGECCNDLETEQR